MSELQVVPDINPRNFRIGGFALSPTSIRSIGVAEYDDWVSVMSYLRTVHDAIQFWIGDAVNLGKQIFGDKADQIVDASELSHGLSQETIRNYAWVAKEVPPENRRPDLSFTHHQAVAGLIPSEQVAWLDKAAHGDTEGPSVGEPWSSSKLKEKLQEAVEKEMEYGLVIGGFKSPADRDIAAQEHERIGRPVKKTFRMKPKVLDKIKEAEQL